MSARATAATIDAQPNVCIRSPGRGSVIINAPNKHAPAPYTAMRKVSGIPASDAAADTVAHVAADAPTACSPRCVLMEPGSTAP